MEDISNIEIGRKVQGMVAKKCWSILWSKKEIYVSDMTKKGYPESSIRSALTRFCAEDFAVKSDKNKGCYLLHSRVKVAK